MNDAARLLQDALDELKRERALSDRLYDVLDRLVVVGSSHLRPGHLPREEAAQAMADYRKARGLP